MESSRHDCSCNWWRQRNRVRLSSLHIVMNAKILSNLIFWNTFRYAIVEELAGFGAEIHVCDISETLLNKSLSEWEKKGFKVSGSVCDVTSRPERETLMQTVSSLFNGKLDIFVSK